MNAFKKWLVVFMLLGSDTCFSKNGLKIIYVGL